MEIPGDIVTRNVLLYRCRASAKTDPPQDCDWPHCGCDAAAIRVMAALQEEGYLSPAEANELITRAERAERRVAELEQK